MFVQHLVESLEGDHRPGRDDLVALDSMPLTLPKSLRHRCAKVNRNTVGGGVLWSYALGAARGCCPVKIHKVMAGAWMDAGLMDDVELLRDGWPARPSPPSGSPDSPTERSCIA